MTALTQELKKNRPLCIYHGNCADGFGAAWVVWKYFNKEVDFHAGTHGEAPPDVKGRDVIIVDFSYKKEIMRELLVDSKSLLILDHHKTAIEDLQDIVVPNITYVVKETGEVIKPHTHSSVFDISRSGTMITWDHFFPGEDAPQLLKHIQDRDLWKFELDNTEIIQGALFSYTYDFDVWNTLITEPHFIEELRKDGLAIGRKHHKDIEELIKVTGREMLIGGVLVPVANLPYTMSSDAGHKMGVGKPFAACYYDTPDGRCFSLRSAPDGIDVGEIAKKYGGGGHKHASGFRVPLGWEGDL